MARGDFARGSRSWGATEGEDRPRQKGRAGVSPRRFACGPCAWTVTLPEPRQALGSRKPQAQISWEGPEGTATDQVPVAVARALLKEGEFRERPVRDRADFLGRLRVLNTRCAEARLRALVDRRDYAVHEARGKLVQDGYPGAVVEDVLARAQSGRLLDDGRFTEGFVRGKRGAGWGRRRIEQELQRRGIDPDRLAGWPEEYFSEDDEEERAWALVARRSVPAKNPYEKTVRFLVGKGYDYGVAKRCARRVLEGLESQESDVFLS